tara:strand:+ start:2798 stop:3226 length:429 start_codon:yes stop_codon:yes gene_type:complete
MYLIDKMSITEIKLNYEDNCIFPNSLKNEVKLYTLFKKNAKKNNIEFFKENEDIVIEEMSMIRVFLNENKIIFPMKTKKINKTKEKLSSFLLKNMMDIILIFVYDNKIYLLYIDENEDDLIEGIKKLLFVKEKKMTVLRLIS